jgi:uncharacterized protein with PQ loop repeat
MTAMVLPVMLVVANILGAGMIVPQVVRLHRVRSAAGLSGTWVGVGIVMNAWWIAYALAESLWGVLPVSTAAVILYSVIAVQYALLVGRQAVRPLLIGIATLGVLPLPFLLVGGWSAAGIAVGLSYGLQFSPAALAAVRSRHLEGVSPTTWTMAWFEAAVWFAYGASIGDAALLIGGAGGALASGVILARLLHVGRSRPALEVLVAR